MKIAVASANPVKLGAARRAFEQVFPDADLAVASAAASSGVSDQPMSDAETREGAHNRARGALEYAAGADYGVGMEGGIERLGGELIAFAWMVVATADGRIGEARSITLPLPPAVRKLIDDGLELGEANDRVFSTVNSKQGGGAYGLLTNGLLTRESVYTDTLIVALTPFASELYDPPGGD
jgi:inosine/xanthosine triphosphatase